MKLYSFISQCKLSIKKIYIYLQKKINIKLFFSFFSAARINDNVEKWIYGAEYNFSGYLKMITSLESDKGVKHGTVVNLSLICRSKEPDFLRCQLENTVISRLKPQGFDNGQFKNDDYNNYRSINLINIPFEINFNKNGINYYTFDKPDDKNIPMFAVNMARLVGNQLNFGNDFSDEMRRKFRGFENSTVGECQVDFDIIRQPLDDSDKLFSEYLLMPLDKLGESNNEIISISKNRNLKNCLKYGEPFFGTRYTLGLILRDVQTKLV